MKMIAGMAICLVMAVSLCPVSASDGDDLVVNEWGETIFIDIDDTISDNYLSIGTSAGKKLDMFAVKLSPTGKVLAKKVVGGKGIDTANGIALDSKGTIYIVGATSSVGAGKLDVFAVKLSPTGEVLAGKVVGGKGIDTANGIALDSKGTIYIVGATSNITSYNTARIV